jgi:hypothetical protein
MGLKPQRCLKEFINVPNLKIGAIFYTFIILNGKHKKEKKIEVPACPPSVDRIRPAEAGLQTPTKIICQ